MLDESVVVGMLILFIIIFYSPVVCSITLQFAFSQIVNKEHVYEYPLAIAIYILQQ